MVFNRGNKLCRLDITVSGEKIDNVKSFKYLGFSIGSKNCSLSDTCRDLSIKTKRAIFALNSKIKLSCIPVKLALKIFNTQLEPILLYGAEVWGPYVFTNQANWEKLETEKVHTQFLKRILGCDIHTSNVMTRTELGRSPLYCKVIRKTVSFIQSIVAKPDSLVYEALQYEKVINDDKNIFQMIKTFTPFHGIDLKTFGSLTKSDIFRQIEACYNEIWRTELANLSKAETYKKVKSNIGLETYLSNVKNAKHRKSLSRLRLSNHQLMIEKGRHHKKPIPRTERLCKFCKVVEDELHFIVSCDLFENERESLFEACRNSSALFEGMDDEVKLIFILTNEDTVIESRLGNFVYNSFRKRSIELEKSA